EAEPQPRAVLVVGEQRGPAQPGQLAGPRPGDDEPELAQVAVAVDAAVLQHERPAPALQRPLDALAGEVAAAAVALRGQEPGDARRLELARVALADDRLRELRPLCGLVVDVLVPAGDLERDGDRRLAHGAAR